MNAPRANAYEYCPVDDGPNSREMAVNSSRLEKSATNLQIDNQNAFLNTITDSTLNDERVRQGFPHRSNRYDNDATTRHYRVKDSSWKNSKTKIVRRQVESDGREGQAVRSGWNRRRGGLGTAGGHGATTGVADDAIAQERPRKCCEPIDTSADQTMLPTSPNLACAELKAPRMPTPRVAQGSRDFVGSGHGGRTNHPILT